MTTTASLPTTGNPKLDEALEDLPGWAKFGIPNRLESLAKWIDAPDAAAVEGHAAALEHRIRQAEASIAGSLGIMVGVDPYGRAADEKQAMQAILALADLAWTGAELRRLRFWQSLTHPNFAYVTSGHPVVPDSFHVYHRDPMSPSGVVRAGGGPKTDDYRRLIDRAGRRTCASAACG